jgi:[CysO sulfur-carrier protein]-S-L-cysteine hydrolase
MIAFQAQHLKAMADAAKTAYPNECCGLIVGHSNDDSPGLTVTRIAPSPNVSQSSHRDSFEVDPKVRFDLMRAMENSNEDIIGHYHSHPDHPAKPSDTDLAMVYEPDLIWVILSVDQSRVVETCAYRVLTEPTAFSPIDIHVSETSP